ncbi:MAG: lysine--tRNA ligase, partial [Alphaproteobacteria bacterium]|nr:lysine--tRNA ligase [Alphaproteobacteria bacterium]
MSEANAKNTAAAGITDPIEARQHKLAAIRAAGFDPYPYTFPRSDKAGDLQDKYAALENGAETTDTVAVAGRIMAMRNNGLFIDLMDASGKIQVFSHKDSMPADQLAKLDFLDIGDIVGATGTVRRTPRGELSVRAVTID